MGLYQCTKAENGEFVISGPPPPLALPKPPPELCHACEHPIDSTPDKPTRYIMRRQSLSHFMIHPGRYAIHYDCYDNDWMVLDLSVYKN